MKILKLPFEKRVICKCGCEFEFDYDDIMFSSKTLCADEERIKIQIATVQCPFCNKEINLQSVEEKLKECLHEQKET